LQKKAEIIISDATEGQPPPPMHAGKQALDLSGGQAIATPANEQEIAVRAPDSPAVLGPPRADHNRPMKHYAPPDRSEEGRQSTATVHKGQSKNADQNGA
jgi:hypothetical protein